ncbi:hypothetical protein E0198_000449 [Clavispora lusitaniae]|nr:hypothetical protein E0198_000449 [Clavispora lusitaniae]
MLKLGTILLSSYMSHIQKGRGYSRKRDYSPDDEPIDDTSLTNSEYPQPNNASVITPEHQSEQANATIARQDNVGGQPTTQEHKGLGKESETATSVSNDNGPDIDHLRKKSRRNYIHSKFETALDDLRKDVALLESRENRSATETKALNEKKRILDLMVSKEEQPDAEFEIPDEYFTSGGAIDQKRKRELLKSKYVEVSEKEEKKKRFENQWELDQLKKAQTIVSSNPDEIQLPTQPTYDFVFDESQFVDFSESEPTSHEPVEPTDIPKVSHEIEEVRKSLPVYQLRQSFLDTIEKNQVLIVVGETGSGKTTQLPQYLYEAGYTKAPNSDIPLKIGCTQPRRVAATSVATRVAEEVGCVLGEEVGYCIRFDDTTSQKTAIKYVTDGMLLREFMADPLLSTYSALMIDEAHERTVSTEIVLTLLKDIIKERKDLKLIVASATINATKFSEYFDGAPIFNIPGRRFPVDICYTKSPEANYIQAAITTVFQIHLKEEIPGDILVFLTGQEEIETMEETLNDACQKLGDSIKKMIVAPIYANMPPKLQKRIFEPTPHDARKVILATNIAETSITIDGVRYVVDPGYVKENVFNPSTGMESLVVVPCSRASADQRAGRAGRVGPGKCYRLYTKWSFYNELQANPTPEILRVNLSTIVLLLLSMGITDLVHFDFMDPPNSQTLIKSLELLYALGALNSKGELTKTGRRIAEFPMDPMFGKCLLSSDEFGVTAEILSIMAMLSESGSLFFRPKDKKEQADKKKETFAHDLGDHFVLLNIWEQWSESGFSNIWCEDNFLQYKTLRRVKDVRTQLENLCRKIGLDVEQREDIEEQDVKIQKTLLSGFFPNVARLSKLGTNYVSLKKNQSVFIHPSSSLFPVKPPPKIILYHELVLTSKEYMRNCMIVEEKWIQEIAKHYYQKEIKNISGRP